MQLSNNNLMLVARSWHRRSRFTSVERFMDFFPQAQIVTNKHRLKRPARLLKTLSRRARQDGYSSLSAGLEVAALWHLLRTRPRIVHFLYADHDYHYLGQVARRLGAKVVGTFWFSIEEFERRMPDKRHLRQLDLVIASGRKQMDYLSQFVDSRRLAYLPLGVDTAFFRPPAEDQARWQAPLHILQVGINRRDFETARVAFVKLHNCFPGIELHMVGCPEAKTQFNGTPDVVFHPLLDDAQLLAAYQRAVLLLLPLLEGGSSNALNEALATWLPIVATRMPNLDDYASEACVSFCPPADADRMAETCAQLLSDQARWMAASRAAQHMGQQFGWQHIRLQLLDLYKQYLGIEVEA
jgi:glycosyltransferase involved in cell wall biosynthesis